MQPQPEQSQQQSTPTLRQSAPTRRQSQTQHPSRTYPTAVDLPPDARERVVGMLNQSLADTTDLMTQFKVAHWNVKGIEFYQLHLLFDEIAETLTEQVDVLAERATALGGEATGSVRTAAATSQVPEVPRSATTGVEYLQAMAERLGVHANALRRDIDTAASYGDEDTADLYTELSREVDKQLYFLEAHLQAGSATQASTTQIGSGSQQATGGSNVGSVGGQQRFGSGRQSTESKSAYGSW